MKPGSYIRGLVVLMLFVPLTACLNDTGTESGTRVEMSIIDPDSYSCNPIDQNDNYIPPENGVHASLYYLEEGQPAYRDVNEYFEYGRHIDNLDLFLNQIFIPTRPFDRGFVTAGGTTITTETGDTLYEYFALRLKGKLTRGDLDSGLYQLALLSDDGSVLNMDFGNGLINVVDNNGQHPTRLGCAATAVQLDDQPIDFELLYNQGPRYHIALTLLARPWPADNDWQDVECGQQGNSRFFDSTQNPPEPQSAYLSLLDRGWKPLEPANYLLPDNQNENPCSVPAPVIVNVQIENVLSNSITVIWDTDIGSTSELAFKEASASEYNYSAEDMVAKTVHRVVLTGLQSNTNYLLKARSRSSSGLLSESNELSVRTRR